MIDLEWDGQSSCDGRPQTSSQCVGEPRHMVPSLSRESLPPAGQQQVGSFTFSGPITPCAQVRHHACKTLFTALVFLTIARVTRRVGRCDPATLPNHFAIGLQGSANVVPMPGYRRSFQNGYQKLCSWLHVHFPPDKNSIRGSSSRQVLCRHKPEARRVVN